MMILLVTVAHCSITIFSIKCLLHFRVNVVHMLYALTMHYSSPSSFFSLFRFVSINFNIVLWLSVGFESFVLPCLAVSDRLAALGAQRIWSIDLLSIWTKNRCFELKYTHTQTCVRASIEIGVDRSTASVYMSLVHVRMVSFWYEQILFWAKPCAQMTPIAI